MAGVELTGYIVVPDADLDAVLEALPTHVMLTREEPGCLVFRVEQRDGEPCVFDVFERFHTRTDFDAHQERVRASSWGQVTANVERHYTVADL